MLSFHCSCRIKKSYREVINSASNFEISIESTAKLISDIMNREVQILSERERIRLKKSEVNRLFGCNNKLKSLTNWEPSFHGINGFKKGLEVTIDWFSDPQNLSLYKNDYVI